MGKPYAAELERLPDTYSWCLGASVAAPADWVRANADRTLLAVGSGGSFTAVSFCEFLHQTCTGRLAKSVTPLEVVHAPLDLRQTSIIVLTAGGKNPDIIGAFSRVVEREPRSLALLCTRSRTPLAMLAARSARSSLFEYDVPGGKDGYLATNSLLATLVLLTRAYESAGLLGPVLPDSLSGLLPGNNPPATFLSDLAEAARPLWGRRTLVVLHTPTTRAGAVDLESRFSEAALGGVQLADYRNFAHGRHYWLAARGDETGIVALVTREVKDLVDRTLRLVPAGVPILRVELPGEGVVASFSAVLHSIHLAQLAGDAAGVDPGKPAVPEFGRRLYRLQAFRRPLREEGSLPAPEAVAIERKSRATIRSLESRGELGPWRSAYQAFRSGLLASRFDALVFDYDGTLCESSERFVGPRREIIDQLERLVRAGVVVGVATGRGKSVKEQLRERLDRSLWGRVPIAYYNGSEVGLLADDELPGRDKVPSRPLDSILELLSHGPAITGRCSIDSNRHQLSVVPLHRHTVRELWQSVRCLLESRGFRDVRALRSDHSVDILAGGVSKAAVFEVVRRLARGGGAPSVLCVGDRGCWPGNDCDLLSRPHSLSVDETSTDPACCWNLASPGTSHTVALLEYLALLECGSGFASFGSKRPEEDGT